LCVMIQEHDTTCNIVYDSALSHNLFNSGLSLKVFR
jgi:hypothetical protein